MSNLDIKNKVEEEREVVLSPNIHFLLVEDDEVDIMNITRAFKKNNISNKMHIAHDGQESLDMLMGTNGVKVLDPLPSIIILDINMPRMNGLEFLKIMRQDERLKSTLVYVMSTSNETSDIATAYSYNVAGYILKPIRFNNFVDEVAVMKKFWSMLQF